MERFLNFLFEHRWEIFFAIIFAIVVAGVIEILFRPIQTILTKFTKSSRLYQVLWKKSSSLKPEKILGLRGKPQYGYHEYYFPRIAQDRDIRAKIQNSENVLVTGNPLSGKSRAIYEALVSSNEPYRVIIPRLENIQSQEDFRIPLCFFGGKKVLLLDDIDKYADKQNFDYLLQRFLQRDIIIIASCRSGKEFEKMCKYLETFHFDVPSIFGHPVEISKITNNEAAEIVKQTSSKLPDTFDGNIGSIFLGLDAMIERYRNCSDVEKGILHCIRCLYYAGIYKGREVFSLQRIKYLCQAKEGIKKEEYEWNGLFTDLKNKGFIETEKDELRTEETYLKYVIDDSLSILDNLAGMISFFVKDPKALLNIGNQAYSIGTIDIHKADYMCIAIQAYEESLKVYTLERFPMDYAMTQNNLGTDYRTLAEVETKADNCKLAIQAYEESLKVYTLERFPMQYGTTQNNLGTAYSTLAEVETKADNCKLAIQAYEESLKVRTLERFPMDYAMTQNNLGTAYSTLAEVEAKADNCKLAIQAYEESLKVFTEKVFPEIYLLVEQKLRRVKRFYKGE
ncbi:tetratricopeptide repeat protein [Chloroflexota bacterium]